jgi:hypothetical protein
MPGFRQDEGQVAQVRQIRFRALITLDPAWAHPGTPLHPAADQYPNHTHALVVRAHIPRQLGGDRSFPAEICWDDDQPLHPGEHAIVTITVRDDKADAFFEAFEAGQRFTLWSGEDVGSGVVSRRVFSEYVPS